MAAAKGPLPAPGVDAARGAQVSLNPSHPGATVRSARELGHRLLTKVDIRVFLAAQVNERWTELQMTGDEALHQLQ